MNLWPLLDAIQAYHYTYKILHNTLQNITFFKKQQLCAQRFQTSAYIYLVWFISSYQGVHGETAAQPKVEIMIWFWKQLCSSIWSNTRNANLTNYFKGIMCKIGGCVWQKKVWEPLASVKAYTHQRHFKTTIINVNMTFCQHILLNAF